MRLSVLLFAFFLSGICNNILGAGVSINTLLPSQIFYGQKIWINFSAAVSPGPNNKYQLELSDSSGSFSKAILISEKVSTQINDSILFELPLGLSSGGFYFIRVNGIDPIQNGNSSLTSFSIYATLKLSGSCNNVFMSPDYPDSDVAYIKYYYNGMLLNSDYILPVITRVAGNGNKVNNNSNLNGCNSFLLNGTSDLIIAEENSIKKWRLYASSGEKLAGTGLPGAMPNELKGCNASCMDSIGNLYIADTYNHRVQFWAKDSTVGITVAGGNFPGSASNQLNHPTGVLLDHSGNLIILDRDNHRIQKWMKGATSGITIAGAVGQGSSANQLNTPGYMWMDSLETLFICDNGNSRVQKWLKNASSGTTIIKGSLAYDSTRFTSAVCGFFMDKTGDIYVIDSNYRSYRRTSIVKWKSGASYGQELYKEDNMKGLWVDDSSNIYYYNNASYNINQLRFVYNRKLNYKLGAYGIYEASIFTKSGRIIKTNSISAGQKQLAPPKACGINYKNGNGFKEIFIPLEASPSKGVVNYYAYNGNQIIDTIPADSIGLYHKKVTGTGNTFHFASVDSCGSIFHGSDTLLIMSAPVVVFGLTGNYGLKYSKVNYKNVDHYLYFSNDTGKTFYDTGEKPHDFYTYGLCFGVPKAIGIYKVCAYSDITCRQTFLSCSNKYYVGIIDGLNQNSAQDEVTLFPNPNSGFLNILFSPLLSSTEYEFEVINYLGNIVHRFSATAGTSSAQVDLSFLPDGLYIVEIKGSDFRKKLFLNKN